MHTCPRRSPGSAASAMRAAGEKGVCMHQQSAATPPVDTAHWLLRPHRGQVSDGSGSSGGNEGMVGVLNQAGAWLIFRHVACHVRNNTREGLSL